MLFDTQTLFRFPNTPHWCSNDLDGYFNCNVVKNASKVSSWPYVWPGKPCELILSIQQTEEHLGAKNVHQGT
jgi:hypothetical protein